MLPRRFLHPDRPCRVEWPFHGHTWFYDGDTYIIGYMSNEGQVRPGYRFCGEGDEEATKLLTYLLHAMGALRLMDKGA